MAEQGKTLAEEVLRLDQAATPGPWETPFGDGALAACQAPTESLLALDVDGMAVVGTFADAALIAAYRTAAPELAREVLQLQESLESSREGRKMECDELERQLRQCQGELLILRTAAQRAANDRARIERERDTLRAAVAYRPGLPTVAQVGAHEERGGWWQTSVFEKHDFVSVRRWWAAGDHIEEHNRERAAFIPVVSVAWCRPCLPDGTPCPWLDQG